MIPQGDIVGAAKAGGGGGGGSTIGGAVTGGNPNDVLFVGPTGNLAQSDDFTYVQGTGLKVGVAASPAVFIDTSTPSSVTGVAIKSGTTATTITATSSGSNADLTLSSKGFASATINGQFVNLQSGALSVETTKNMIFSGADVSFGAKTPYVFTGNADGSLTASAETMSMYFNFGQTRTHATGAIALLRSFRWVPPTHAFAGASVVTNAATIAPDGAPIAGALATFTNTSTYYSPGTNVGAGSTNSYGINLTANTGATNNYIASLNGSAGEVVNVNTTGKITLLNTLTPIGTTGAQTIDKPSGTVTFAAAATSLVVTNALCTTSSTVFATVRTNDTTAQIFNVVPANGSFTIRLVGATTAATSVGFLIIN